MSGALRRALLWTMLGLLAVTAVLGVAQALGPRPAQEPDAPRVVLTPAGETDGFARAIEPRPLHFPEDHGPHLEYQTEWWYYVGNLQAEDGRHFGFQLTFFRRGLQPGDAERPSAFGANHIYSAHLALTDTAAQQHRAWERYSRGAFGLAGGQGQPFRLWLDDWSAQALDELANLVRLSAAVPEVGLELTLQATKPPVLHGEDGLSRKGPEPGNASFYVSYTRMTVEGRLSVDGAILPVQGEAWFDHEWGSTALGPQAVGWDWFGLQLEDGHELMAFQIRREDGTLEPESAGTLVAPDGTTLQLAADQVLVEPLGSWTSPLGGVEYPSGWRVRLPDFELDLTLEPWLADQENRLSVVYWEGAVQVRGTHGAAPVSGVGYVELTGYQTPLQGDF